MRRSMFALVAVATLGSLSQAAMAAEMPVKALPPVVEDWTGMYIGGNVGYSWGRSETRADFFNAIGTLLSSSQSTLKLNGFIAGGQIGYNKQINQWLLGLEADLQWSGQDGDAIFACPGTPPGVFCNNITGGAGVGVSPTASFNQSLEWFATLRLRVGLLVDPTLLAYVTGGLGVGKIETKGVLTGVTAIGIPTSAPFAYGKRKGAWVIGGGLEKRMNEKWSAKLEYLYFDYGHVRGSASLPTNFPPLTVNFDSDIIDHVLRIGLNYRWYRDDPVVTRY